MKIFVLALLLALAPSFSAASEEQARLLCLVPGEAGFPTLAALPVPSAGLELFSGPGQDLLGVVLPPQLPGISGAVVQGGRAERTLARVAEGQLRVSAGEEGSERELALVSLETLASFDIRVSVLGGDGRSASWAVGPDGALAPDPVGPPLDLFRGLVPLGPRDFVVTTETHRRWRGSAPRGAAELVRLGRHLAVDAGDEQLFLVDTAASKTVVSRAFAGRAAVVEPATMVERSGGGERVLEAGLTGATGAVTQAVQETALDELAFGELRFTDCVVRVLDELPVLDGRAVAGILGSDLLGRSERVALELPAEGRPGRLTLGAPQGEESPQALSLPFSVVSGVPFLRGGLGEEDVVFVLDTGASWNLLRESTARSLALAVDPDAAVEIRGLSARPVAAPRTHAVLRLGEHALGEHAFHVAELPVLGTVPATSLAGILGAPFLSGYTRVELRFDQRRLLLVP